MPDPAVSELLALKIENIALNIRLMQMEQDKLVAQARLETETPDGLIYNIGTRRFQAPDGT